jgi:predicted RNase H-like nuclease (RuvC/YqgF family)
MSEAQEAQQLLKSILEDHALQYTVGKEALAQMLKELEDLQDKVADLTERDESHIAAINRQDQERQKLQAEITELSGELSEWHNREADLKLREKQITELEIRNEYENRRGDEFKELMHATVRNSTMRRNILGGIDSHQIDGYTAENGMYVSPRTETTSRGVTTVEETEE